MTFFANQNRAAIVYQPGYGYMVVTSWMHGTGGGRYAGDHHVSGNDRLPMLAVEGYTVYPPTDEGRRQAMDRCMLLNDQEQLENKKASA